MIAGGGTGGHLFPALGIAKALREIRPDVRIEFAGSQFGMESTVLPQAGEVFHALPIRGLQRGLSPRAIGRNLLLPWRLAVSAYRSRAILRSLDPHVAVGTGGYAAALPLSMAQRRGIPTLLQEQNSFPGLTTRRLAPRADLICLTYGETADRLRSAKTLVTGNPIPFDGTGIDRASARGSLGLPSDKPVVFILGGSQGSRPLNLHFEAVWQTYAVELGTHLLWQTGAAHYADLDAKLGREPAITLLPFVDDMAAAYRAADLVISRAGAMTLSELALMGKAAILVPFPSAAADHQTHNARLLADAGAARLVPQQRLAEGALEETVKELLGDPGKLERMGAEAVKFARPDAGKIIANEIIRLAQA